MGDQKSRGQICAKARNSATAVVAPQPPSVLKPFRHTLTVNLGPSGPIVGRRPSPGDPPGRPPDVHPSLGPVELLLQGPAPPHSIQLVDGVVMSLGEAELRFADLLRGKGQGIGVDGKADGKCEIQEHSCLRAGTTWSAAGEPARSPFCSFAWPIALSVRTRRRSR